MPQGGESLDSFLCNFLLVVLPFELYIFNKRVRECGHSKDFRDNLVGYFIDKKMKLKVFENGLTLCSCLLGREPFLHCIILPRVQLELGNL